MTPWYPTLQLRTVCRIFLLICPDPTRNFLPFFFALGNMSVADTRGKAEGWTDFTALPAPPAPRYPSGQPIPFSSLACFSAAV